MDALLKNLKRLQPEVDYQALMAEMKHLSHPRRKLKELQNKGYLTRVKKGFYVFSNDFIGRPYSPEIVANLIYGPSYLSLEYALSFYGLIPERVSVYTSVTSQKNKKFQTPIGAFSYSHLHSDLYPYGVGFKYQFSKENGRPFLIASPEKAVLDLFTLRMKSSAKPSMGDLRVALEDDWRIDVKSLRQMVRGDLLENMKPAYRNRPWCKLLIDFLLEDQ